MAANHGIEMKKWLSWRRGVKAGGAASAKIGGVNGGNDAWRISMRVNAAWRQIARHRARLAARALQRAARHQRRIESSEMATAYRRRINVGEINVGNIMAWRGWQHQAKKINAISENIMDGGVRKSQWRNIESENVSAINGEKRRNMTALKAGGEAYRRREKASKKKIMAKGMAKNGVKTASN